MPLNDLGLPGWVEGPAVKYEDSYLSHPEWVGTETPEWFMGHPWGLGGRCHYATAYVSSVRMANGWCIKKKFAGMDHQRVEAAAREWLAAQEAES